MKPKPASPRTATASRLAQLCVGAALLPLLAAPAGANPSSVSLGKFRDNIVSGGPPKDGIPSIDNPRFTSASKANDFLDDDDAVFGVVIDGEARAYPRHILVLHEIVNDELQGKNIAVTYCPLTHTAMGFMRGETTFGVSGRLINSNLVMYDRQTDSYWPQILGAAIKGERKGETLERFPVKWTTWEQWRDKHPDTDVMTRRTRHARDYTRDPYGSRGYYQQGSGLLFPPMSTDDRLPNKALVVSALTPDGPVAVSKTALREAGHLTVEAGHSRYLAVHDDTLDTGRFYELADEESLTEGPVKLTDRGPSQAGRGLASERVTAWDAYWFAWVAFYPETVFRG